MILILLSGAIGSGKSTIARLLAQHLDAQLIEVRTALAKTTETSASDRGSLQIRGAELEARTQGRWLADYIASHTEREIIVVDAVRTVRQVAAIQSRFEEVFIAFLDASIRTRRARFEAGRRVDPVKLSSSFDEAMSHPTEVGVAAVKPIADLVLDTETLDAQATVERIADGFETARR